MISAVQRLGATQSAASPLLYEPRKITGDPLFVKSQCGFVATACAKDQAVRARELLFQLQGFTHAGGLARPAGTPPSPRVFFDDTQRAAPTTRVEYEAGEHIIVVYEPNRPLDVDRVLAQQGVERQPPARLRTHLAAKCAGGRGGALLPNNRATAATRRAP